MSDSSKDPSVLKWCCSGKASWVAQGDCGEGGFLGGGGTLWSLRRKLLHAHTVHSDTVKQSDQGAWLTSCNLMNITVPAESCSDKSHLLNQT